MIRIRLGGPVPLHLTASVYAQTLQLPRSACAAGPSPLPPPSLLPSQAPDGAVLCTCGAKKVRWYLERGLAVVEAEAPMTIRLKFEPRGRGHADDEYYLVRAVAVGWEKISYSIVRETCRVKLPMAREWGLYGMCVVVNGV